jgi:hypothetical protein
MLNSVEDLRMSEETVLCPPMSFVLALAAADSAPRTAAAYVSTDDGCPTIGIGRFNLEDTTYEHLLSLATMAPVNLCVDKCATRVAISQSNDVHIFCDPTKQTSFHFNEPVEQFGFIGDGHLVLRCGTQLFLLEPGSEDVRFVRSDVRHVIIGIPLACVCTTGDVELLADHRTTISEWSTLPNIQIPAGARAYVQPYTGGLLIWMEGSNRAFRRFCQLYRVEHSSPKPKLLFADTITDTIGRDPARQFFGWHDGRALILAERSEYSRLWIVDGASEPRPVSPEQFEVISANPSSDLNLVAIIGTDMSRPESSAIRRLCVLENRDTAWTSRILASGSFALPKWCNGSRLVYARDALGCHDWTIAERISKASSDAAPKHRAQTFRTMVRQDAHGTPYTVLRSRSLATTSAILYVQGPHRQILSAAQDTFFHQWLLSSALQAASQYVVVVGINGPGSLGLGAQTSRPTNLAVSLIEQAKEVICSCISDLQKEGIERIGILSGSLGALSVLNSLTDLAVQTACCFVSAVLDPTVALDAAWLSLFGNEAQTRPRFDRIAKGTKLMFIHGDQDEFTPATDLVRLARTLRSEAEAKLVVLPGESHIFRKRSSWKHTQASILTYFRSAL